MKSNIHPAYNPNTKISCACGATFSVGSTSDNLHVEICSNCHPFYTGKQKLVDTAGRVDKYRARIEASKKMQAEIAARDAKKVETSEAETPIENAEKPQKSAKNKAK